MPLINIPGFGPMNFPDTMSKEDIGVAIRQDILPSVQKSGFGAGISGGIESLKGAGLAAKYGITGAEADRQALLASQAKASEKFQGVGLEDVQEAFKERGVMAGLGRTWEAAKGTLGQSIPFMAAPAIGAAAAPALLPAAGIAGLSAGAIGFAAPSLAQYTGTGLARQVEEQQAAIDRGEAPRDLSLGKAALAAIPATVLDRFALGKTFKGTALGKLFGEEGEDAVKAVADKVLSGKAAPSKILSGATGLGRGVSAEIGNEVGQQILERAQAGLDLTGEDAMREYKQAAFGAALLGGPIGTLGGLSIRKAGLRDAENTIEEARTELNKAMQQRQQLQLATEAQNLAQTQPQLPGMEAPLVGPGVGVRPEVVEQQAPEFGLVPQNVQGELDLGVPEQPVAPEVVTPAKIDYGFLKGSGLAAANSLKEKGKNSIIGLDLNDPADAAKARENLTKVGETTKSGKVASSIEELLKSDPRLQEQPELTGLPTEQQQQAAEVERDQQLAATATAGRNKQLQQLLFDMEAENAAKEEASRVAAEQADAAKKEQLAKGVTEDMFGIPTQQYPAVAPEVEQPSAGVPSEVGVQDQPVGPEPSVDVYDAAGERGAPEDRDIGGGALGAAGQPVEARVAGAGEAGDTLTPQAPNVNQILAGLRKEGLTREEARQQVAEATPEELADLAKLYAPVQKAAKTTTEQEAEIAAAAQTEGEFGDISARNVPEATPTEGVPLEEAKQIVAQLLRGWNRDVKVQVVNRNNLPEGFQQKLLSQNLLGAKGFIDENGTIFVIANNNKNAADIAATMFHETLGHLGLRLKFRNELASTMNKFYNTNAEMKRLANQWLLNHKGEYDEGLTTEEKRAKAVEEVLAERAEAGRLPASIWDKLKALFNKYARMAGIKRDFSNAEIRAILDQAQQEVTKKTGEAKTEPVQDISPRSAISSEELDALYAATGNSFEEPVVSKPFQEKIDAVKQIANAPQQWIDKIETMVFSGDAALNNAIRRALISKVEQGGDVAADALAKLYSISTSQSLHAEALAHEFIDKGDIYYDNTEKKFVAKESDNSWRKIIDKLHTIAKDYDVPFVKLEGYAQAYLEARRLEGITQHNADIEASAAALLAKGKKDQAERKLEKRVRSHMSPDQIAVGLEFAKRIPELKDVAEMWNGVRKNAMTLAVDSGIYSAEEAQDLLDVIDYVPFYRVEQIESGKGPKEFSRGLLDAGREYRLKGVEYDPEFGTHKVNNIFDNMERWASYTVRRAVGNKKAQELVQVAQEVLNDAREVPKARRGMEENTVAVWQNGERKFYEFSDPLFVKAFQNMNPAALKGIWKSASVVGNFMRKNIVLNPLFSISQLPQDAFAAMLTSGLKNPWKLPLEVMKEFYKTLKGTSDTHAELKKRGAVGTRDWSTAVSRADAEIEAGLKNPTTWQKLLDPLEKFSMASDNAVRQAIYNMTMKETGGDKAQAVERAFEVINFRRKGASANLAAAGQVIPFFNAYLQAQNVAYKVLTGRGISPTSRKAARETLARNTVAISALAFMYAAMMADDDDYKNTDPTIRDRHWMIPGTGIMIPVRTDLFSMPKIIAEHTYALLTDQGFEDPTKAKRAIWDAFKNAVMSPTVAPQMIKPLAEVYLNKNFYTGRPIVGHGLENVATSEQFTNGTSEFAKVLGSVGPISPLGWDHLIKGYLGTTGGLGLMATDMAVNGASGVPRPEKSYRDMLASTPGLSTFVTKEFGSADKTDFYELAKQVGEVNDTFNRLKAQGRGDEIEGYMTEENQQLMALKKPVADLREQLSAIRKQKTIITQSKEMTSEEKGVAIRELDQAEKEILQGRVRDLRQAAGF